MRIIPVALAELGDDRFRRPFRFVVVGLFSSLAYVGTMSVAVDGFRTSVVSGAIAAFIVGTAISYLGNSIWTFGAKVGRHNLMRFLAVTLVGLALNTFMAWGLNIVGLHHLFIGLVILITVPIFNFFGHTYWTYQ